VHVTFSIKTLTAGIDVPNPVPVMVNTKPPIDLPSVGLSDETTGVRLDLYIT
jgi:hypothetical protein